MVRSSKKLIELVRANPCLYDRSHPKYLNVGHKRELWAAISAQMELPTVKCKTRWNNMRDSYRKATLKKTKTYKYSRHLSFLNPFLKHEVSAPPEFNDTCSNSGDADWDDQTSSTGCKEEAPGEEAEAAAVPYYLPEFRDAGTPDFGKAPHVSPYVCPEHPVDAFLGGVAPALKGLRGCDLSMAKMEIYQVVHKYELKALRVQEAAAESNGALKTEEQ